MSKKSLLASYFIGKQEFSDCVIFIYDYTDIVCKGIIINKMCGESESAYGLPVYYGGPEALDTIVAVHSATAYTKEIAPLLHVTVFHKEIIFIEKPKSCFFAKGLLEWDVNKFICLVNKGYWIYADVNANMILTTPPAYRAREANAKAKFMNTMPIYIATS